MTTDLSSIEKIKYVNYALEAIHEDLKVFVRTPYAKFFAVMAFWNKEVIARKQLAELAEMDPFTGGFGRLQKFLEDELYLVQIAKKKGPSGKEVEFRITERGRDRGRMLIGILNYALNHSDIINLPKYAESRPLLMQVLKIVVDETKKIAATQGNLASFTKKTIPPRRIVVKKNDRKNET